MKQQLITFLLILVLVGSMGSALAIYDPDAEVINDTEDGKMIAITTTALADATTYNETKEETETTNEETEEETDVEISEEDARHLSNPNGARIRQLQLLKRVIGHIYLGNEAITYIEDEAASQEAQLILEELATLAENIEAMDTDSLSKEETVKQFVAFKEEATSLSKQFHKIAKEYITADGKKIIMEAMKEIEKNDLDAIHSEIKELTKKHNHAIIVAHMKRMGYDDTELLDKIESGDIILEEVKTRIKAKYQELSEDKREAMKTRLEAHKAEEKERITAMQTEMKAKVEARVNALKEERHAREAHLREQIEAGNLTREDVVARIHQTNDKYRAMMRNRVEAHRQQIADEAPARAPIPPPREQQEAQHMRGETT